MIWLLLAVIWPISVCTAMQTVFPALDIADLTSAEGTSCMRDLQLLRNGVHNKTLWAMRMVDATAQGASGLLHGSTWQMGNYDECLEGGKPFATQFCLPQLKVLGSNITVDPASMWAFVEKSHEPSSLPRDVLHTAVCVPKSCSPNQLQVAFQAQLDDLSATSSEDVTYAISVDSIFCTASNESQEFGFSEITFWVVCALVILAAISGSFISSDSDCRIVRFFKCFSFKDNVLRLLDAEEESSQHLSVLHGLKVASIFFIVYGHRFGLILILAVYNYQEVEEWRHTNHNMFIMQADLVVDTFFFVSGVVATYILCALFERRSLTVPKAIFARIFRLAPTYYMLVWYQASAAFRLGSGPVWNVMQGLETRNCVENWWANIFFFNNYLPAESICLVHSWFIPCDVHFFLLACLLVTLLVRQPKVGLGLLTVLTLFSPAVPALVSHYYNLKPVILFYNEFLSDPRSSQVYDILYVKSHNRVAVYLIGICVGYFLHRQKDSKHAMSKWVAVLALIVGPVLMLTSMKLGSIYYDPAPPGHLVSVLISGLRRPIWGIGLSILLIAHRFGPKNAISRFLSCRACVVLSKLTFGVYLIHFVLILSQVSMTRSPYPFTIYNVVMQGLEDTTLCFIFAAVLYVLLDLPVKRILREVVFVKKVKNTPRDEKIKPEEVYTVKL